MRTKTIAGYTDKLSVAPGETVRFLVSCDDGAASYRAGIVRLICTDDHPEGPGLIERPVKTSVDGEYPGRRQPIHAGSYAVVPSGPALAPLESFTVQAMIWPTTPAKGRQSLLGTWSEETRAGFALEIDESGAVALRIGDGEGDGEVCSTGKALPAREWALAAASYDAATGEVHVYREPVVDQPRNNARAHVRTTARVKHGATGSGSLVIAAHQAGSQNGRPVMAGHYNGKIDGPRLANRALTRNEIEALRGNAVPRSLLNAVVAAWDFSRDISSETVTDLSPNRLHGETVNLPTRAMKGWNWAGEVHDWKTAPEQYGAIHFHDDDLYDAGWNVDFELTVPADMRSGVYAAKLESGAEPEHVVFFVRAPRGTTTSKVLYLAPTATYMAYANFRTMNRDDYYQTVQGALLNLTPEDLFLNDHPEYGESLYGHHSDDSGVCYTSRLRPIVNMRPNTPLWAFNGDGYLTAWFDAMGYEVDVATDEDVHNEGIGLLESYAVVVTGCHPEYASRATLDALEVFVNRGGRLMYLGGNGFYWRIAYHPVKPDVIEMRRAEAGIRAWEAEPGEYYMGFTGEYGGMWRRQDRAPNRLTGIGFAAQGFNIGSYYRRMPGSFDARARFIFEGIGEDERIGDFGLAGGGAAGQEIDRYDRALGSPSHALVLATSENHDDSMLLVSEEIANTNLMLGGTENPLVRADMVFFETAGGGAVFSTGSISWPASLPWNNYDNNVSRITDSVLKRFLDETPFD